MLGRVGESDGVRLLNDLSHHGADLVALPTDEEERG